MGSWLSRAGKEWSVVFSFLSSPFTAMVEHGTIFPGIPGLLLGVMPGIPVILVPRGQGRSGRCHRTTLRSSLQGPPGSGMGSERTSAQHMGWFPANQNAGCRKRANQNRRERRLCACASGSVTCPGSGRLPSQRNLIIPGAAAQSCWACSSPASLPPSHFPPAPFLFPPSCLFLFAVEEADTDETPLGVPSS